MALNMRGNHMNPVDLTLDSDDDDAPATHAPPPPPPPPPPRERSNKTSVPLPANVRHLYPSVAPPSPRPFVPLPGTQSTNRTTYAQPVSTPAPREHPRSTHSTSAIVKANSLSNRNGYVSVFASSQNGQRESNPDAQAGKRRKLSLQGTQILERSNPGASSTAPANEQRSLNLTRPPTESNGHEAPRSVPQQSSTPTLTPSSASGMKLAANRLPSVQFLNNALKTSNGAKTPFPAAHSAAQPRALQLGQIRNGTKAPPPPDRGPPSQSSPIQDVVSSTATKFSNGTSGRRAAQLSPWQADELVVDRDDEKLTQSFAFRTSPLKKTPIPSPNQLPNDLPASCESRPTLPTKSYPVTTQHNSSKHLSSHRQENRDSIIFDSEFVARDAAVGAPRAVDKVPAPHSVAPSTQSPAGRKKLASMFSEEESHLLIFLKEVKKLAWKDLVVNFNAHFPGRKYHTLQTHYSTKLNRRDRTLDPATLNLPACYATDAVVDWVTVHDFNPGPRTNCEATGLQHQAQEWQHSEPPREPPALQNAFEEQSSGAESVRPDRPRRAVPPKDYTWPKRNRHMQTEDEILNEASGYIESIEIDVQSKSEESDEELQPAPEKAIPVDNEPLDMIFQQHDALLALSDERTPYLASSQRFLIQHTPNTYEWDQLCSRDWDGSLIHVDFRSRELEVVERAIGVLGFAFNARHASHRKRLQSALRSLTEPKILQLSNQIHRHLPSRDRKSIKAFLEDAQAGKTRVRSPRIERLVAARPDKYHSTDHKASTLSMIRQRESGLQNIRGWRAASRPLTYRFRNKLHDSLGPALSYTGASSDVHAAAWSTDGQCFAAGAICVDDPDSMQYNRPNNLLFGDVYHKAIYELGEHNVSRPRTVSGPNSTHAMYASQDPKLYKTVSAVAFSPNGRFMFSGGYDNNVCIWETKTDGTQPELIIAMKHKAELDMLAVNRSGLLATASKKGDNHAVKVIAIPEDEPTNFRKRNLGSRKAAEKPDYKILPTALQFSPRHENLLLAGFGANARTDGRDANGDICIWDISAPKSSEQLHVHGSGRNVFDLAFHARHPWFAVGCVAGQNVNRGTRSTVRIYDENGVDNNSGTMKYGMRMELECKALDMNDVVWCPGDDHLVAAGCTSGRAYVWDVRWPDHFLRELAHGRSLMPLDDYIDREITDTGIRFLSWGDNATRLYTGSSDGVVKVWNVVRSEEETFVKDLITTDSGIMSGSFSPDKSKLILGEVNGSINVLEVGRDDCSIKDTEKFKYFAYTDIFDDPQPTATHDADSGIAAAAELLESGQMRTIPMGGLPIHQAVQGSTYAGPFDSGVDAPFLREQALEFQYNLARDSEPQCTIASCADAVGKITGEEMGDSGRSADRIPDELRQQFMTLGSNATAIPGRSHCTSCGRAARPPNTSSDSALCERCSFACFRCGAASPLQADTHTFACATCNRIWDIGALGYECTRESDTHTRIDTSFVPALKGYEKDLFKAKMATTRQPDDSSFGDEMNALTDYYFGLAIGRPESPPL